MKVLLTVSLIALVGCKDATAPEQSLRAPKIMDGPCEIKLRFYMDSLDRTKGSIAFTHIFTPCPDTIEVYPAKP